MYGEILKYGAYIVDALREYKQSIFVYIPTNGELRGGAWVVIDSSINPEQMEFYAAQGSKGGVLEPEGVVDIKFCRADLVKVMKRSLPQMQNVGDDDGAEKKLEKELMPTFKQLATHFAALHDTPGVCCTSAPLRRSCRGTSRGSSFASRLRMRVAEERVKALIRAQCPVISDEQMASHLSELRETLEEIAAAEDEAVVPEEKEEVMRLIEGIGT